MSNGLDLDSLLEMSLEYLYFATLGCTLILTLMLILVRRRGFKPDRLIDGLALVPLVFGIANVFDELKTIRTLNENFVSLNNSFYAARNANKNHRELTLLFGNLADTLRNLDHACKMITHNDPQRKNQYCGSPTGGPWCRHKVPIKEFAFYSAARTGKSFDRYNICDVYTNLQKDANKYAQNPELMAYNMDAHNPGRLLDFVFRHEYLLSALYESELSAADPRSIVWVRDNLEQLHRDSISTDPHLKKIENSTEWGIVLVLIAVVLEASKILSAIIISIYNFFSKNKIER